MTDAPLQPPWLDSRTKREGRYALGPLLGHGGMGEVYEAWDTILARPVALKVLRHLEPAAMIRFMHEAQLHARLDCPNICRIYDVDASNGTPRIAMQLVRGPNLEDAAPDLTLDEIITIIIQVAEALDAAHHLKLIHRDIKPSNILLQWSEERGWIPYICDFGLAMALDGPTVTQPLAMTGTPAYMAPEQVRGDRSHICPATDVYGVGSTLYFTLTGRPPCVSTVTAEVLRVKRERRFPSPRALEPEIPPDLETILLKCLQPAPADRYPTTAQLAQDLRRFQKGQAIQAVPNGALRRLRKWGARYGALLAATGGLAALIIGLAVWQRSAERAQARQSELAQYFTLEAAHLEQSLGNERMLPVHDLRPAYAQTRARMEALRDRLVSLGPDAEGPLHYALGRAHFFLREYPAAGEELQQAWSAGFRSPETAFLLARLQIRTYLQACGEADFQDGPLPPAAGDALARAQSLFHQARGLSSAPPEFAEATLALARKDYSRAAELARASLNADPWYLESAALASLSLSALGAQLTETGKDAQAQIVFHQALDTARTALSRGQSDEELHHALCVASLGLAALDLDRGGLSLASLESLQHQTDITLALVPEDPEAQSDWLRTNALKIIRMTELGQDPRRVLDEGLQFFWTRTREPRSADLRVDHMVLYFLEAQWDEAHRQDPGPALAEALKEAGHAVGRHRDFYGDLLNFKAGLQASRGMDPNPTLEPLLQQVEPAAERRGAYCLFETSAQAWLTRARWETKAGRDAAASLHHARNLLQRALQIKPTSAASRALLSQDQLLEHSLSPARP